MICIKLLKVLMSTQDRIEAKIGSIFLIQCISLLRVLGVVVAMCHWSACLLLTAHWQVSFRLLVDVYHGRSRY